MVIHMQILYSEQNMMLIKESYDAILFIMHLYSINFGSNYFAMDACLNLFNTK